MFAALFATYAVLTDATADGPSGRDLFDLPTVAVETGCLLLSTVFCGFAGIGAQARRNGLYYGSMAVTFVLGATFVAIELHEFATMIHEGAGPGRSAFLSAFFALIGCHGLHVSAGLLWLLTMMAQVYAKGYRPDIRRRLLCFALLAHPRHHLGGPVQSRLPGRVAPNEPVPSPSPRRRRPATSSPPPTFPMRSAATSSAWRWRRC